MSLAACAPESGPPVSIVAARILAPMPGSSAGVAYFTIENQSATAITINRVGSPQFADVQMHETTIENGVSRMRPLKELTIEPSSSADFVPGGKHVMLMKPTTNISAGVQVTLEIHYDSGLLIVNATMQDRMPAQ